MVAGNIVEMVSCQVVQCPAQLSRPHFLISVKKTVVMETKDLHQEVEIFRNNHISDFFPEKNYLLIDKYQNTKDVPQEFFDKVIHC